MYQYMDVLVYVPVYGCSCVCTSIWMFLCMYQYMDVLVYVPVYGCSCVCTSIWTFLCMYQYMDVLVYVPVYGRSCVCTSMRTFLCMYQYMDVLVYVPVWGCSCVNTVSVMFLSKYRARKVHLPSVLFWLLPERHKETMEVPHPDYFQLEWSSWRDTLHCWNTKWECSCWNGINQLFTCMYNSVWKNGRGHSLLTQHWVHLRVWVENANVKNVHVCVCVCVCVCTYAVVV